MAHYTVPIDISAQVFLDEDEVQEMLESMKAKPEAYLLDSEPTQEDAMREIIIQRLAEIPHTVFKERETEYHMDSVRYHS